MKGETNEYYSWSNCCKLTVGDNIKTKDGKIVVGETTSSSNTARSAGITLRQAQAEIKRNMKTTGTLQEQYVKGLINESTYKQSRNSLYRRNGELAKQIRSNGTAADWASQPYGYCYSRSTKALVSTV